MNSSHRAACLLITSLSAAPLAGCSVDVSSGSAALERLARYEGTDTVEKIDYAAGKGVRILSANGDVDVETGDVEKVEVTFSPFTMDEATQEVRAVAEMEDKLKLSVLDMGDIVVQVARAKGYTSYLGANIKVVLPKAFDGAFELDQNTGRVGVDFGTALVKSVRIASDGGSIDVVGARGRVDVVTDGGDVSIGVSAWSVDNGSVKTGNGDITFSAPADVNGKITASGVRDITEEGIPSSWTVESDEPSDSDVKVKNYTMGDGTGAVVALNSKFGDITVKAVK